VRVYRLTEAARAELDGRFLEAVGRCWPPAEAGPERLALFAVGASPAVLRRTAAAAALLALLGAAPAVAAGLLPVAAIYAASPTLTPLQVPWAGLAVATLLFPLPAAAGGATLTRTGRG
jgi:hypothetical protein